jgi:HEAT repeat protein
MTMATEDTVTRALQGLESSSSSVRLRAALAIGTAPDPRFVDTLVERCAVEAEFSVREILTSALTRHPSSTTVPKLVGELRSERAQARSQALHALSKIGDRRAWPAITRAILTDADDEVARSAWRTAVVLVPDGEEPALAAVLATQLGRGGRETQLSLSRALVALGEVVVPTLRAATADPDPRVRRHAIATERLSRDPDAGYTPSVLVDDLIRRTRERLAAETELLTRLRRIGAVGPAEWEDVLRIVALLQALGSDSAGKRQRAALSSVENAPVPVEALVEAVLSEADPNVAGALRWALVRSGDGALALLADGLGSPAADVRKRAVQTIVEMPDGAATRAAAGRPHPLRRRGAQECGPGARSTWSGRRGPDARRHGRRGGERRRRSRCAGRAGT